MNLDAFGVDLSDRRRLGVGRGLESKVTTAALRAGTGSGFGNVGSFVGQAAFCNGIESALGDFCAMWALRAREIVVDGIEVLQLGDVEVGERTV